MAQRNRRSIRPTLLVVGEGDCEEAFLRHLRALYCADHVGVSAKIYNARGKGPENVIEQTRRQAQISAYDRHVALLDTDLDWTPGTIAKARKHKIMMIGSEPCLEGLLLTILGQRPPSLSDACKRQIHARLRCDLTEPRHYEAHFPRSLLESARTTVVNLDMLLRNFEGRAPATIRAPARSTPA